MGDFPPGEGERSATGEAACRVEEVPEGRGRVVRVGDRAVAVFNDGGAFFALLDRCPHAGASLGGGWVEDGAVVCPLHRWRFRLADGHCVAGGEGDVPRFECEVRGGRIWVSGEGTSRRAAETQRRGERGESTPS